MSARVLPTVVGGVEGRLTRALAMRWPWIGASGALLIAAAAQAGFDDRFLTSIAIVVPVAFVVRLPRAAGVVATIAALGWFFPQGQPIPVAAGVGLTIVYGVAAYRLTTVDVCVVGAVFLVNAVSPFNGSDAGAATYLILAVVVASLAFGRLLWSRSTIISEHEALALAHASALREHLLLADRTAIARELHDVVAHHISHIAIQAETARYTTPDLPDLADTRLSAIGESARTALAEMRTILRVIRSPTPQAEDAGRGHDDSVLTPRPGLDQLDALVEAARRDGTPVAVTVDGPAAPIPADTDLIAYRVIQESLTNARRHAPGAAVHVAVDHTPGTVRLTIHNGHRGPVEPPDGTGLGLIGMRERVEAVGGTLRHGPLPDGGFTVVAELPLRPAR